MGLENYKQIYENCNTVIKPFQSRSFEFDWNDESPDRLFFTGETATSYFWKSEPDYQQLYRNIDDSLSAEEAENDRWALDFSGESVSYRKLAAKKLTAPFLLSYVVLGGYSKHWRFGIRVKAESLSIKGFLRAVLEIRYKREGVDTHYALDEPDVTLKLDVPEGSYGWTELFCELDFDMESVASLYYIVEGEQYSGAVFFEQPCLVSDDGHNIISEFCPRLDGREHFNWLGMNLSKIEWQSVRIELNNVEIFDGEFFERCHRMSEKEVRLPKHLLNKGKNTITFANKTRYREAPGLRLGELGFVFENKKKIFALPENVVLNTPFPIFADARKGERFDILSDDISLLSGGIAKRDGICAIWLVCSKLGRNIEFSLNGVTYSISRCVVHGDDGVITGTGDLIYINANREDIHNYLKWYLSSNIGNLLTIRSSYRWNGTRELNGDLWRELADILSEGGIYYSHMLDGRELQGCDCNPGEKMLDSDFFLGRQAHELDGQHGYWGTRDFTNDLHSEMFYDMFSRMYERHKDTMPCRYTKKNMYYRNGKRTAFISPVLTDDMQIACERFIASVRADDQNVPRHTGPTVLFKYFCQAGYKNVGAELMYSSSEICSAMLRGVRKTYGERIGAHHAVQWSTYPHDTKSRYRRYYLALFLSYIHEIDEINTEEGLWRLEQYYSTFNRFSSACIEHKNIQKNFYRYISTHTRSGHFYTPFAFLSGRYDGWQSFVLSGDVWGVKGFGVKSPEKAWELLREIYPRCTFDNVLNMNCPDEPQGFYTGTPYGNVDIVPIEADNWSDYKLLVAVGYNKAITDDMDKLYSFVENGGVLIIGWPQFSTVTNREAVVNCRHEYISHPLVPTRSEFIEDTFNGCKASVAEMVDGEVVIHTDNGRPLVVERLIGDGKVIFVNAREWADNCAVYNAYKDVLLAEVKRSIDAEQVWAKGNNSVQFAVYENSDGSKNVYFISTDWYSDSRDGEGVLIVGGKEYVLDVPFGTLVKVAVTDNRALYPLKDECEVVSITDTYAAVQGVGVCDFISLNNGKKEIYTVNFNDTPFTKIYFN